SLPRTRVAHARPTENLSSGLVGFGDSASLLHGAHGLRSRHRHSRLANLEGSTGRKSQRDCRHALIVRHVGDEDAIIVAEAVPAIHELAPGGLARLRAAGFKAILWVFELGSPGLRGIGKLAHIERHVRSPSLLFF